MMRFDPDRLFLRGRGVAVTKLDIIKSIALIIMVIDHVGYFFLDSDPFWRAVGRIGLPIWFVLAGFTRPKNWFDKHLLLGGSLLVLLHVWAFDRLFPVNTLWVISVVYAQTLILQRLRPWLDQQPGYSKEFYMGCYIIFLATAYQFTNVFGEYGSLALMLGLWGYLKRETGFLNSSAVLFIQVAIAVYTMFAEIDLCGLTSWPMLICILGLSVSFATLYGYAPATYASRKSILLRIGGRYTLEFYVLHLFAFTLVWHFWYAH